MGRFHFLPALVVLLLTAGTATAALDRERQTDAVLCLVEANLALAEASAKHGRTLDVEMRLADANRAIGERLPISLPEAEAQRLELLIARLQATDGQPEAAIAHVHRFLAEWPASPLAPEASLLLGRQLVVLERQEEAEAVFLTIEREHRMHDAARRACLERMRLAADDERYSDAAGLAEHVAETWFLHPDAGKALMLAVMYYRKADLPLPAIACLERVLKGYPNDEALFCEASAWLGYLLFDQEDHAGAYSVWKTAGERFPESIWFRKPRSPAIQVDADGYLIQTRTPSAR